ncbi:alkaline phosphatase family protein [Leucobacter denitrificans]|uniref:Alkaline phosphatase family protein n=2 Tax=Leucobacter denitrificans TaxID=683042 RepID=A0A7G9S7K8_9MICO|nr:alkaline phosphatase family protein [Leucobacter denitrificans]
MLPTATDNGGRLAALLPTGLLAIAKSLENGPRELVENAVGASIGREEFQLLRERLPAIRSLVVIMVDGLGTANLKARSTHAPTLASLSQRRITTVSPSTTSAAITTLTTGKLPGEHGHIGYKIRHPELGIITSLRDWEHIPDVRAWQLAPTLFELAARAGIRSSVFGRPAHAESGFSRAVLTGASYIGGSRIADRFAAAKSFIANEDAALAYVYIDELDRAGHKSGWQSESWAERLEQLDAALADFLVGLPADTGVVLTADHGMVDVEAHQQVIFDRNSSEFSDVVDVGGEPRFRSFYLREGSDPHPFTEWLRRIEGKRAWVVTRAQAFESGVFGNTIGPGVPERTGDVLLAARGQCAYYMTDDDPQSFNMVGQHGSWTDEERGIPLILAGDFAGSGYAKAVESYAQARDTFDLGHSRS